MASATLKSRGTNQARAKAQITTQKPSKYRNVKVSLDGYLFDSKKEARRYQDLLLLQKAGEIQSLEPKPEAYEFSYQGVKICKYLPDFRYIEAGKLIVEDVKGKKTRVYSIKKKLMLAFYNIKVRET